MSYRHNFLVVVLKEGIFTVIYKKGGVSDPRNYRGITVTDVLLKCLNMFPTTDITKSLIGLNPNSRETLLKVALL